jgi:5-methylcytosine-specific restriction endonuclease McrA
VRDRWYCHYCDVKLYEQEGPTVDHKVPKSRGGKNTLENLFVALFEEVGHAKSHRKTIEQVSGLYHERLHSPDRPQWNAVLCGSG